MSICCGEAFFFATKVSRVRKVAMVRRWWVLLAAAASARRLAWHAWRGARWCVLPCRGAKLASASGLAAGPCPPLVPVGRSLSSRNENRSPRAVFVDSSTSSTALGARSLVTKLVVGGDVNTCRPMQARLPLYCEVRYGCSVQLLQAFFAAPASGVPVCLCFAMLVAPQSHTSDLEL